MKNSSIFLCTLCGKKINTGFECTNCGKKYKADDNGVLSFLCAIDEEKRKVAEKYDALSKAKNSTSYGRFSTYLNYGFIDNHQYCGGQRASLNLIEEICKKIDLQEKNILEVGCGRGGNLFYINANFEVSNIVGMDISYLNIMFCKNKKADIDFVRADAENLPFINEAFDILLNIESALHYSNINSFYDEVSRVLTYGGIFVYVDIVEVAQYRDRKEYLHKRNLDMVFEEDYTNYVINSMKEANLDSNDDETTIFEHKRLFQDLFTGKKQYIVWIMRKIK